MLWNSYVDSMTMLNKCGVSHKQQVLGNTPNLIKNIQKELSVLLEKRTNSLSEKEQYVLMKAMTRRVMLEEEPSSILVSDTSKLVFMLTLKFPGINAAEMRLKLEELVCVDEGLDENLNLKKSMSSW